MILIALGWMIGFDFGSDSVSDSELINSHLIQWWERKYFYYKFYFINVDKI